MKILSAFFLTLMLSGCVKIYELEISTPCEKIISNNPNEPIVTTVAGDGISAYKDGLSNQAEFSSLRDIAIDKTGNIYALDGSDIRKVSTNGVVSTILKSKNDSKDYNISEYPTNIEIDNENNIYFINNWNAIDKISPSGKPIVIAGNPNIRGFADGSGTNARFENISDFAIDNDGNIFVVDNGNHRIRKITKSGDVSTIAGSDAAGPQDGAALSAAFFSPNNLIIDSENNLYLLDDKNIRKISNGVVSTIKEKIIENDTSSSIQLRSLTMDNKGNFYFITDNFIKKMTPDGKVSDFAGTGTGCIDGSASKAKFNSPSKIIYYNGFLYISDSGSNRIRKIKI